MKKYILTPLAVIAAVTLLRLSFYTVDAAEYGYVTVLGEHRETFDGKDEAGLKFGWPWPIQQVQRLDRRLQQFDLPTKDELTHNPDGNKIDKVLSIEAYVCWKITDADGANQFMKRIGSAERARAILAPLIVGRLGAAISMRRMDDLVNTTVIDAATGKTRVDVTVEELRQQLLGELSGQARAEFGIELVDIRLRRFNHPLSVRDSIFARIIAERKKEAAQHISKGDLEYETRINEANADARVAIAQAKNEEERIKARTDVDANKIRQGAWSQDEDFFKFLKQMEKLQAMVGESQAPLLLSTHWPMFKGLFTPPLDKTTAPRLDKQKGAK
jgi:membrane protease subunit HflC